MRATIHVRRLAAVAMVVAGSACAPVNPSARDVVGRWKVEWTCGSEGLDLKPDGTYEYTIDFKAGGRLTDAGRWTLVPKQRRRVGAHVVLHNALRTCSAFGDKVAQPERTDRELETISEWGRTILIFNPDLPGFTRQP